MHHIVFLLSLTLISFSVLAGEDDMKIKHDITSCPYLAGTYVFEEGGKPLVIQISHERFSKSEVSISFDLNDQVKYLGYNLDGQDYAFDSILLPGGIWQSQTITPLCSQNHMYFIKKSWGTDGGKLYPIWRETQMWSLDNKKNLAVRFSNFLGPIKWQRSVSVQK